jgi:ribose/xylose/arabinose/galactoside ABC-type transport system permease subunit
VITGSGSTQTSQETPPPPAAGARGNVLAGFWATTAPFRPVLILLVALFIVLSIWLPSSFLTGTNIQNILTAVTVLWIVSMGMTFALLSGGVDLSVSANGALSGFLMAKILGNGVPAGVAIVLAVAFGAVVGLVLNGFLIGKLKLSFFVVTLASMTALTGVVNLWSRTLTIFVSSNVVGYLAIGHLAGIAFPIWIMAAVFVVAYYVQRWTYFGRDIYAVGGSLPAARLSGIRTVRTVIAVYGVTGGAGAFAGVILVGSIGSASPTVDGTLPLLAVAAVLLGGTAITGGAGSVVGTALGVLFIGVLQNGLSIGGVSGFWQDVVTGIILVAAVLGIGRSRRPLLRVIRRLDRARQADASAAAASPEPRAGL